MRKQQQEKKTTDSMLVFASRVIQSVGKILYVQMIRGTCFNYICYSSFFLPSANNLGQ